MKKFVISTIVIFSLISLTYLIYENFRQREGNLKSAKVVDIAQTHDNTIDLSTIGDEIALASVKADGFYTEETIRTFTDLKIAAINDNDFSLIEKFLLPGSKVYESQKQLVSNLASKNAKTELFDLDYDVVNAK